MYSIWINTMGFITIIQAGVYFKSRGNGGFFEKI